MTEMKRTAAAGRFQPPRQAQPSVRSPAVHQPDHIRVGMHVVFNRLGSKSGWVARSFLGRLPLYPNHTASQ